MIRVLVSSCLLGERVRYHGGDAHCSSPGQGVTAAMLARAGIRLFNERQLEEAAAYLEELEAG